MEVRVLIPHQLSLQKQNQSKIGLSKKMDVESNTTAVSSSAHNQLIIRHPYTVVANQLISRGTRFGPYQGTVRYAQVNKKVVTINFGSDWSPSIPPRFQRTKKFFCWK